MFWSATDEKGRTDTFLSAIIYDVMDDYVRLVLAMHGKYCNLIGTLKLFCLAQEYCHFHQTLPSEAVGGVWGQD